jgi:hypothetical protein
MLSWKSGIRVARATVGTMAMKSPRRVAVPRSRAYCQRMMWRPQDGGMPSAMRLSM